MSRKKTDHILLALSVVSFLLLGISFVLMPIDSNDTENKTSVIMLVAGVLFWFSLAAGLITQGILSVRRKKWISGNASKKAGAAFKPGLISFFKNKYAVIADIGMVGSLIGLIIVMIMTSSTGFSCYVFAGLFVFLFSMHCILNGKNYIFALNPEKFISSNEYTRKYGNRGKEEKDNG